MMMRSTMIALAIILLPTAVAASPAHVDERAPESRNAALLSQGIAVTGSPAIETLRGVIDSVDQRADSIDIRLSSNRTERFRVQDGLIFDAVRFGEPVEISVQNISGARTIVRLLEE